MRKISLAALLALGFFAMPTLAAEESNDAIINNSSSIDIVTSGGGAQGPEGSTAGGISSGDVGTSGGNPGSGTDSNAGVTEPGGTDGTGEVTVTFNPPAGNAAGGEQDQILSTLSTNHAATSDNGSDGSSGGLGFGGLGSGSISIDGAAARDALHASGVNTIHIAGLDAATSTATSTQGAPGALSGNDMTVVVASVTLDDDSIENVTFGPGAFSIIYNAKGNLFALLPLSYRMTVNVTLHADGSGEARVTAPWYRFLMTGTIAPSTLEGEMRSVIAQESTTKDATIREARVFIGVAKVLKAKP